MWWLNWHATGSTDTSDVPVELCATVQAANTVPARKLTVTIPADGDCVYHIPGTLEVSHVVPTIGIHYVHCAGINCALRIRALVVHGRLCR
jgi:hypothetical protein